MSEQRERPVSGAAHPTNIRFRQPADWWLEGGAADQSALSKRGSALRSECSAAYWDAPLIADVAGDELADH